MQTSLQALEFCEQNRIAVFDTALPLNRSISGRLGGKNFIAIDERDMTEREKKSRLWHEIGHCATGSFYNIYAARDLRQRHENRADKWAIRQLISEDELDNAIASGCTAIWQLAEHFNLDEKLVRFALQYYFGKAM